MQYQTITKENIKPMLDRFYSQVLKDELVADFFIQRLGDEMISDEWQDHLELLTNFWASIILHDNSYKGRPIQPHIHMQGLQKETFQRWLKLFFETLDKCYTQKDATIFKKHSQMIANNFIRFLHL